MVKCLLWEVQLLMLQSSFSLSLLAFLFAFSVCQPRLWRSFSSFLQGDSVDMPRAKGYLLCTSSKHHAAVSVDSPRKCETNKKTNKQNIWIYLLTTILYARATGSHWFNAEGLFPTWLKRLSRTISYQICFDTNIVEQINVMTTLSEQ